MRFALPGLTIGLLALTLACSRESKQTTIGPKPEGQVISNGGDRLRLIMDRARDHLAGVIERLPPETYLQKDLDLADRHWLESFKASLLQNLRDKKKIRYSWEENLPADCGPGTCACTAFGSDFSHFSYRRCGETFSKPIPEDGRHSDPYREDAARLIFVEEHHRLVKTLPGREKEEQAAADRLANWIFEKWHRLGHLNSPHWMPVAQLGAEGTAVQNGDRVDLLGTTFWATYSPPEDRWQRRELSNSYLDFSNPALTANDWKRRKTLATPLLGARIQNQSLLFVECHETRLKNAAGFLLDEKSGRWERLPAEGAPVARREAHYLSNDKQFIVWGGYACADDRKLFDGGIYEVNDRRWTPISPVGLQVPDGQREGESAAVSDGFLFVWGGESRLNPREDELYSNRLTSSGATFDLSAHHWRATANPPNEFSATRFQVATTTGEKFTVYEGLNGKLATYSPTDDSWELRSAFPLSGNPPNSDSGLVYAFANSATVLYIAGGNGWIGNSVSIYDIGLALWNGPILSPLLSAGGSMFDLPDPRLPFYREPRRSVFWNGFEWTFYEHDRGFRFFP